MNEQDLALKTMDACLTKMDELRMAMRCCKEDQLDRLNEEFTRVSAEYKANFNKAYNIQGL
jgi:hypothetical protein